MFKRFSIILALIFTLVSCLEVEGVHVYINDSGDSEHLHDQTRRLFSKVRQVLYVDNEGPINIVEVFTDRPELSPQDDPIYSLNEALNYSTRAPPPASIFFNTIT